MSPDPRALKFFELDPDKHSGSLVKIKDLATTRTGRLVYAQNPSYKIRCRHWYLRISVQDIPTKSLIDADSLEETRFQELLLSLQWVPDRSVVVFIDE
jgi:hypothetical protein